MIFKGQDLTDEEYIAFAQKIGTPEPYFQKHYHLYQAHSILLYLLHL